MKKTMSIRLKANLTITIFFLSIVGIVFLILRIFALNTVEELDRNQGLLQFQRIQDGLSFTTESMKQTATDWSIWDETFFFVEGSNPDFVIENFYLEAMQSIDMDMVLVFNNQKRLLYQEHYLFDTSTSQHVPFSIITAIETTDEVFESRLDSLYSGFLTIANELFILVSSPIMTSDFQGEPNGTLIFLRKVDSELIASIEQMVGIPFRIVANSYLTYNDPIDIISQETAQLVIRGLVVDINSYHNLMIEATVSMESSFAVYRSIQIVVWLIAIVLTLLLMVIILILNELLFKRISRITNKIKDLSIDSTMKLRIPSDQTSDEISFIQAEINQLLNKLEVSYHSLNKLALTDHLTGTTNRLSFVKQVDQFIMNEAVPFSILLFDIDGFKEVNDRFGHDIGDEVLIEVANRIQSILPLGYLFSRSGGDEFLLFIPSSDRDELQKFYDQMIRVLSPTFRVESESICLTISSGVSYYPNHGLTVKDLIKKADLAMYQAKSQGKNQLSVYQD